MYKPIIIFGSIITLAACSGVSKQDLQQLASITSLDSHISVKRQRQFAISSTSSVGLIIKGNPDKHKDILNGFKYHVRHAELVEHDSELASRYDFIFNIILLKMEMTSTTTGTENDVIATAVTSPELKQTVAFKTQDSASNVNTTKNKVPFFKPIKIQPLKLSMNISLLDAVNGQVIDIAIIDAYSSSIRLPKGDDFIIDVVSHYMDTLTNI